MKKQLEDLFTIKSIPILRSKVPKHIPLKRPPDPLSFPRSKNCNFFEARIEENAVKGKIIQDNIIEDIRTFLD